MVVGRGKQIKIKNTGSGKEQKNLWEEEKKQSDQEPEGTEGNKVTDLLHFLESVSSLQQSYQQALSLDARDSYHKV